MFGLPSAGWAQQPLWLATFVCLGYLGLVYAIDLSLLLVAAVENRMRIRETRAESTRTVAGSRFTIPVSVIVPMRNEEVLAAGVVEALLGLEYPEYEVIVVNDGSTDRTLDILREAYALEPFERFTRRVFETEVVHAIYRSATHPGLTVIDKASRGSKADALNCGLNYAKYRYVCCVDGDTMYARDALLRSMRLVQSDPAMIIGVTSQIVVAAHPERSYAESGGLVQASLIQNFQHIEYLRAFLNDRLAWSRLGFMLCASGAFAVYRRDVIDEVGGFSRDFTCEDIELDLPRPRVVPARRAAVPDRCDAGACRANRRPGSHVQPDLATGALAARDARDDVALPADVPQPALRAVRIARECRSSSCRRSSHRSWNCSRSSRSRPQSSSVSSRGPSGCSCSV